MATFSPCYVTLPGNFRYKVNETTYAEFYGKPTKPCLGIMKMLRSLSVAAASLCARTHVAQYYERSNSLPSLPYNSLSPRYSSKNFKSSYISPSCTEFGERRQTAFIEHEYVSYQNNALHKLFVKNPYKAEKLPFATNTPLWSKILSNTSTISTKSSLKKEHRNEKTHHSGSAPTFGKAEPLRRPRVLKKKRPQPKVKNRKLRKVKKLYSCNVVYETTMKGSVIEFCTGTKKVVWENPEVNGKYVSFLPSITETKNKDELFRWQGSVRGYPKRTLPQYTVAVEAAVMKREKKLSRWWKVFG